MGAASDFDPWFEANYPRALALARRLLLSTPAAEDAAAEAFARALARWGRVGRLEHRDAWVLRVTANVAIDQLRRRRDPTLMVVPVDGEDLAALRVTVSALLQALPRRQREVVVLHHLGGLSTGEVALALDLSTNTVKTHLRRGLSTLRRQVAQAGDRIGEEARDHG